MKLRGQRYFDRIRAQRVRFLWFSFFLNIIIGSVKCLTALSVSSPLVGLNGIYNYTLCMTRLPYLRRRRQPEPAGSVGRTLFAMGAVLLLLGVISVIFALEMAITGDFIEYTGFSVYALAASVPSLNWS